MYFSPCGKASRDEVWFTQLQRFPGVDFDVEQELREYRFEEDNFFSMSDGTTVYSI